MSPQATNMRRPEKSNTIFYELKDGGKMTVRFFFDG